MGNEPPERKRRVLPAVPRQFERGSHRAPPSIQSIDGSVDTPDGLVEAPAGTPPDAEAIAPPEPTPAPEAPQPSTPSTANGPASSNTDDDATVSLDRPTSFPHGNRSKVLNITFGDFSPSEFKDNEEKDVQESTADSHESSATESTTPRTETTPFTQSDRTVDNAGDFEDRRHEVAAHLTFGPELPERMHPYASGRDHYRPAGLYPGSNGFNPVVNGVTLVHNLLLSFNQPALSDLLLDIKVNGCSAPLHLHSVILQILPTIQAALTAANAPGPKGLQLRCDNPYATVGALEGVLRMPYGGSLPTPPVPPGLSPDFALWARSHLANFAVATFLQFTEVADVSADGLVPLISRDLTVAKQAIECIYADRTQFDHDAPPGHYRDPIKNGRFYHFKLFEAAKAAILTCMAGSEDMARRTLDYAAPAARLLGGFSPAASPVDSSWRGHRKGRSGLSMGQVVLGPDETATTLSTILLSAPIGFLNLLTRDARSELMLAAAVKEREDRRKAYVERIRSARRPLSERARWEERYELDAEGFWVVNRYEVIHF